MSLDHISHQVTLTADMTKRSIGRPSFSHFLCYSNVTRGDCDTAGYRAASFAIPDIFGRGHMGWGKG